MLVALYTRVSTAEQAKEGYSIQEQADRLKKYAEAMSWSVYKVYTDAGYSGATTDRPALKSLISDVKNHRVDKVIVYKIDRLSRSQKDTLMLIEDVFLKNGVDFVSMSENFDTATPFGRAMIGILAVFAQLEREQIKERMMLGKEAKAKQGKFSGSSFVSIGYDYDRNTQELSINEYEALQVRMIFKMFCAGESIRRIEKYLLDNGYSHRYGKWNGKTVRNVLANKTYIGYVNFQGRAFQGHHPVIIDQDTFDTAQVLLKETHTAHKKGNKRGRRNSMLGGLLYCTHCGAKYRAFTSGKWKYYGCYSRLHDNYSMIKDPDCKNKIWKREILDDMILKEIGKLSIDPSVLKEEPPVDIKPLQEQALKIDSQLSRLMDLYTTGTFPLEALNEKAEALRRQKEALTAEIENRLPEREARSRIASIPELIHSADLHDLQILCDSLIDHIDLDNEDVIIHWKF